MQNLLSKRAMTGRRKSLKNLALNDDGAALVEFTIFAPILIAISIYVMDFGLYFFNQLEMQNAAQAGAQWTIAAGLYNDPAIKVAAANAVPAKFLPTDLDVKTNQFCGCPSATGLALYNSSKPTGICTGGSTCVVGGSTVAAGNYVTVTATTVKKYKSFIPYGLFKTDRDIGGASTVRIQ